MKSVNVETGRPTEPTKPTGPLTPDPWNNPRAGDPEPLGETWSRKSGVEGGETFPGTLPGK